VLLAYFCYQSTVNAICRHLVCWVGWVAIWQQGRRRRLGRQEVLHGL